MALVLKSLQIPDLEGCIWSIELRENMHIEVTFPTLSSLLMPMIPPPKKNVTAEGWGDIPQHFQGGDCRGKYRSQEGAVSSTIPCNASSSLLNYRYNPLLLQPLPLCYTPYCDTTVYALIDDNTDYLLGNGVKRTNAGHSFLAPLWVFPRW